MRRKKDEKCYRRALPFLRPSFWSVCETDPSAPVSNARGACGGYAKVSGSMTMKTLISVTRRSVKLMAFPGVVMKTKSLGLIACMVLLGASQARATTYDIIAPSTGELAGGISGTVTTDGTTGTLSASNITSWNINQTINDVQFIENLSSSNSTLSLTGGALTANATELFFNFSATDDSLLKFSSTLVTGNSLQYCDATTACINQNGASDFSTIEWVFVAPGLGSTNGSSPQVGDIEIAAATVGTTPLPAALPLFATGLGAMGLFGWRRKRKNAAALTPA
jgi:hypothetical protein